MIEEWVPVLGFEDRYRVSNLGRVESLPSRLKNKGSRIMKPRRARNGYYTILLQSERGAKKICRSVNRIVLSSFTNQDTELEAAHRDGDKSNNSLTNLYWATHVRNCQDKIAHGTLITGERHHATKLDAEAVRTIRKGIAEGTPMRVFAEQYGVAATTIYAIKAGWTWKHIESNK